MSSSELGRRASCTVHGISLGQPYKRRLFSDTRGWKCRSANDTSLSQLVIVNSLRAISWWPSNPCCRDVKFGQHSMYKDDKEDGWFEPHNSGRAPIPASDILILVRLGGRRGSALSFGQSMMSSSVRQGNNWSSSAQVHSSKLGMSSSSSAFSDGNLLVSPLPMNSWPIRTVPLPAIDRKSVV